MVSTNGKAPEGATSGARSKERVTPVGTGRAVHTIRVKLPKYEVPTIRRIREQIGRLQERPRVPQDAQSQRPPNARN